MGLIYVSTDIDDLMTTSHIEAREITNKYVY